MSKREAGILMPIASLPNVTGIGNFGECATDFVDFLAENKFKYWQMLPIGMTGYGNSPYQSFSAFALNPYFIDLHRLVKEGILDKEDIIEHDTRRIDYGFIFKTRYDILYKAFEKSFYKTSGAKECFFKLNEYWLEDYALFMALKEHFEWKDWHEWDEDIKHRKLTAIKSYKGKLFTRIEFFKWIQYKAYMQFIDLKLYAESKDIKFICDMPIYVSNDSVETWCKPELFDYNLSTLEPNNVAGCPPDRFSATGQLWGNPLYNWDKLKETNFDLFVERIFFMTNALGIDTIRLDHFRGYADYYSIPYGDKTAENGVWKNAYGEELFKEIKSKVGDVDFIAEDLGNLSKRAMEFIREMDYPTMNVLQFGFFNAHSPHYFTNHRKHSVTYTGTHDNQTSLGWFKGLPPHDRTMVGYELNLNDYSQFSICFIAYALFSRSDLAIIPMQDLLGLDDKSRMNLPSTLSSKNWTWRLDDEFEILEFDLKFCRRGE